LHTQAFFETSTVWPAEIGALPAFRGSKHVKTDRPNACIIASCERPGRDAQNRREISLDLFKVIASPRILDSIQSNARV
jgi:hypothetical protein